MARERCNLIFGHGFRRPSWEPSISEYRYVVPGTAGDGNRYLVHTHSAYCLPIRPPCLSACLPAYTTYSAWTTTHVTMLPYSPYSFSVFYRPGSYRHGPTPSSRVLLYILSIFPCPLSATKIPRYWIVPAGYCSRNRFGTPRSDEAWPRDRRAATREGEGIFAMTSRHRQYRLGSICRQALSTLSGRCCPASAQRRVRPEWQQKSPSQPTLMAAHNLR